MNAELFLKTIQDFFNNKYTGVQLGFIANYLETFSSEYLEALLSLVVSESQMLPIIVNLKFYEERAARRAQTIRQRNQEGLQQITETAGDEYLSRENAANEFLRIKQKLEGEAEG